MAWQEARLSDDRIGVIEFIASVLDAPRASVANDPSWNMLIASAALEFIDDVNAVLEAEATPAVNHD